MVDVNLLQTYVCCKFFTDNFLPWNKNTLEIRVSILATLAVEFYYEILTTHIRKYTKIRKGDCPHARYEAGTL